MSLVSCYVLNQPLWPNGSQISVASNRMVCFFPTLPLHWVLVGASSTLSWELCWWDSQHFECGRSLWLKQVAWSYLTAKGREVQLFLYDCKENSYLWWAALMTTATWPLLLSVFCPALVPVVVGDRVPHIWCLSCLSYSILVGSIMNPEDTIVSRCTWHTHSFPGTIRRFPYQTTPSIYSLAGLLDLHVCSLSYTLGLRQKLLPLPGIIMTPLHPHQLPLLLVFGIVLRCPGLSTQAKTCPACSFPFTTYHNLCLFLCIFV